MFSLTNTAGNYAGQYFTATATAASGNTSEFSPAVLATNAPAPSAQFGRPFLARTNGFTFNLTLHDQFQLSHSNRDKSRRSRRVD